MLVTVSTERPLLSPVGFVAASVLLVTSSCAAGLIWLLTVEPTALLRLATDSSAWAVLAEVGRHLLAII